jgi:hypothetical protein
VVVLSEDEKAASYVEYSAIADTPGVSPGFLLQLAETATTVRMQDGKTLRLDREEDARAANNPPSSSCTRTP